MISTGVLEAKYKNTQGNTFEKISSNIIEPLGAIVDKIFPHNNESQNDSSLLKTVVPIAEFLNDIVNSEIFTEYKTENTVEVFNFLNGNISLVQILLQAKEEIKEYFPATSSEDLLIEIHKDSEEEDKTLVLSIFVDMEPNVALAQLNKLRYDWWLNVLMKNNKLKMIIDVNFK
jgi:hypothetical protein